MFSGLINWKSIVYPILVLSILAAASLGCSAVNLLDETIQPVPPSEQLPSAQDAEQPPSEEPAHIEPPLEQPEAEEPEAQHPAQDLPAQSQKATPDSQQSAAPSLPFVDDFEDSNSGWEIGDYDSGSIGYQNGSYFVEATEDANLMWGLAGQNFENVEITVESTQVLAPGNDNNGYGVMCRVQPDNDGYIFRISGDGYAGIHYFLEGEPGDLVDWAETPHINTGNSRNTIRVICNGPRLALLVNGNLVAETTDTKFTSGDIALAATTYETEPTKILYDNIRVVLPQR